MGASEIRIVVFDARRGNKEGEEAEKVLGFYPPENKNVEEIRIVGLLQGLVQFTGSLFPLDIASRKQKYIVENEKTIWTILEVEESIFIALLLQKSWIPRHVTQNNLHAAIVHTHNLLHLAFGTIQALLDEDPTGEHARTCIKSLNKFIISEISEGTSRLQKELRNPFTFLGRTPVLKLPLQFFFTVLSVCNQLEIATDSKGDLLIENTIIIYKEEVLWSTMPPKDTLRLCSLIGSGLLKPTSKEMGMDGVSVLATMNMKLLQTGFVVLKDEISVQESNYNLPYFHNEMGNMKYMLKYQNGEVCMLLTVARTHSQVHDNELSRIKEIAEPASIKLLSLARNEKSNLGHELGHLPGYRYCVGADTANEVKSSPRSKVSAMSHHGRSVTTSVINSMSRIEKNICDIFVQSQNGVWLVARKGKIPQNDLVLVRDKRLPRNILESIRTLEVAITNLAYT